MSIHKKLSRRDALKLGAVAVGGSVAAPLAAAQGRPAQGEKDNRPNFVIFMTDGQRPDELSYMVGKEASVLGWDQNPGICKLLKTPSLDRIASEGAWIKNAFVVNALCAPGRAATLTGLYSRSNGVIDNKDRPLAEGVKIISDYLHEAGYEVAFCGKAHIKDALRNHYWDYYFGYYFEPNLNARIAEGYYGHVGPDREYQGYLDDFVTDAAIGWLQGKRQKPFCLFVWFKEPHGEGIRQRRYQNLYNGVFVPKPETFDDDLKGYPDKSKAVADADDKLGNFEYCASLEQIVKNHNTGVVEADGYIGRVMKILEETGKLDDTVIMNTADHGYFLGEWHLIDKRFMYEPSIRIPLGIRYPKLIKPGTMIDEMVLNIDIAPTVLDLAGVKIPSRMQGRSIVPLIRGNNAGWRKDWLYSYYEYPGSNMVPKSHGVRTERYKIIEYYEERPTEWELYDLQEDPHELHNLYGDPRYSELTERLKKRLNELRKETGES